MSELLNRLKLETADCHQTLERALDLTRSDMERDDYIVLLGRFRGFVQPWEAALHAALPPRLKPFAAGREKTALLDTDLLFMTNGIIQPGALPICEALPPMSGTSQALGSMYVMEGSTLGGRFIGPAMAQRFQLAGHHGYGYFDPYRERTGSMWNAFRACADAEIEPAEYSLAVESARATFAALRSWFAPAP